MSSGPEHYRQAERLIASVMTDSPLGGTVVRGGSADTIAAAQVHATLALAAATAELDICDGELGIATGRTNGEANAWRAAFQGGESS